MRVSAQLLQKRLPHLVDRTGEMTAVRVRVQIGKRKTPSWKLVDIFPCLAMEHRFEACFGFDEIHQALRPLKSMSHVANDTAVRIYGFLVLIPPDTQMLEHARILFLVQVGVPARRVDIGRVERNGDAFRLATCVCDGEDVIQSGTIGKRVCEEGVQGDAEESRRHGCDLTTTRFGPGSWWFS